MKKAKSFLGISISLIGLFVFSVLIIFNNKSSKHLLYGRDEPFSIVFNETKNKFGTGDGVEVVETELNNSISFDYCGFEENLNGWHKITRVGYFVNDTPIHGMEEIELEVGIFDHVGIYYSDTKDFFLEQYQEFSSGYELGDEGTPETYTISYDFDNFYPNFIKVITLIRVEDPIDDVLEIKDMVIYFDCANHFETSEEDKIYFGCYPQTEVSIASEIDLFQVIGNIAKCNPASISFGYSLDDGDGSGDMVYQDVIHCGEMYRAVHFSHYRLNFPGGYPSFQEKNGYIPNITYWFKYELVRWDIIETVTNSHFLLSEKVVDSQNFYHSSDERVENEQTIYANNYAASDIREWLNDDFYNTAFSSDEKSIINETDVDNSVSSTGYDPNEYACVDTEDKLFLLSNLEASNVDYSFTNDNSRIRQATDYAKVMGVYADSSSGHANWWLRSPASDNASFSQYVYAEGELASDPVVYTINGVLPALKLNFMF